MKVVRKNTHVLGKPIASKAPGESNGDNLFDTHLLPYLLYHKASEKEQEKFRLLLHRIYYNGRKVGRKEMKDQMLDLWERIKEVMDKSEIKKDIA